MTYNDPNVEAARRAEKAARHGTIAEQMTARQNLFDAESRAVFNEQARAHHGAAAPPSADLGGLVLLFVVAVMLLFVAAAVVLFTGMWMLVDGPLRSVLEASPLSDSIARTSAEDGSPLLVAVVVASGVLAVMIGLSIWRRRVAARLVRGETQRRSLYLSSLLRSVALFAGLGLVAACTGIAAGADLPGGSFFIKSAEDGSDTDVGPTLVFLAMALGAIAAYTFFSANRVWRKVESRLAG